MTEAELISSTFNTSAYDTELSSESEFAEDEEEAAQEDENLGAKLESHAVAMLCATT